jgi:hypothetical protein
MEFLAVDGSPVAGDLRYAERSLSFDFRADDPAVTRLMDDAVELAYGSLALQVARASGDVLGIWGYHPNTQWQTATLPPPRSVPARLHVRLPEVPPKGVALRLVPARDLTTLRDSNSGWIRIGRTGAPHGAQFIQFATGSLAELDGTDLVAIWLQPNRS